MNCHLSKHWSEFHTTKKKLLYNHVIKTNCNAADITEENFILVMKNSLKDIILNNKNWGTSTKEALLSVMYKWLLINDHNVIANVYFNEYVKMKDIRDNERGENTQDLNEQKNYKNLKFFQDILKNTDIYKLSKIDHMKYLLLSLLVYQPPLRTSFYNTIQFIDDENDDDKINNFILITEKNNEMHYIVNKDKISFCKIENNKIKIYDEVLKNIIRYSYNKYRRKHVLINQWNKNISQNTILIWLKDFTDTHVNVNMLRSAYINNEYSKNKNYNEKNKLAKDMRHNVMSAMRDYVKNGV
jgi:hypothetical protein